MACPPNLCGGSGILHEVVVLGRVRADVEELNGTGVTQDIQDIAPLCQRMGVAWGLGVGRREGEGGRGYVHEGYTQGHCCMRDTSKEALGMGEINPRKGHWVGEAMCMRDTFKGTGA